MAISVIDSEKRLKKIQEILSSDLKGKRIVLIGSAEYGPTNELKKISRTATLFNIYGKQGSLVRGFQQIKSISKDNEVYLIKTTGSHSIATLNVNLELGEIITDGFILRAANSNEIYNQIRLQVALDGITIEYPEPLGGYSIEYRYQQYPTICSLVHQINQDLKDGIGQVYAYYDVDGDTSTELAFYPCNSNEVFFYGGVCGLNYTKNMLYHCMEVTYEILQSFDCDFVLPLDAFVDDTYISEQGFEYGNAYYENDTDLLVPEYDNVVLSFYRQLLSFCTKQLQCGKITMGVIGFRPRPDADNQLGKSDILGEFCIKSLNYSKSLCENDFYSFLVNVVGGDLVYGYDNVIDTAAIGYTTLCASLEYAIETTNVPIPFPTEVLEEFSEPIMKRMAEAGIVTFRSSPYYDRPVPYYGVTSCDTKQINLHVYCNIRMIQFAINCLNELYEIYIGEDMKYIIEKRWLATDIEYLLNGLKNLGILTKYSFEILPYYLDGHIQIPISFETNYTVSPIRLQTNLDIQVMKKEGEA